MAFDIRALVEASNCGECANEEQKKNVALYLLNQLVENGGVGGGGVDCLHNLLSIIHPDTLPSAVSRGSLIVGNATPLWAELTIGAAGTVLTSDGTDVSWSAPASAGTVTSFSAGNLAPLFTTSVATASTTPALTFSLSTQAANLVFAGPASGAAAGPTFRSLVALDLPATAVFPGTYGSATQVGQFTVDQQGRITAAIDVAITFPGGFSGFANPTALVGLVAVNGVATTAMRSDAAPALNQGIVPTWTGIHAWTPPANATPITVTGYSLTGAASNAGLDFSGTWNTTGTPTAFRITITDTASNAASKLINFIVSGISVFDVNKAGSITSLGPTLSLTGTVSHTLQFARPSPTAGGTNTIDFDTSAAGSHLRKYVDSPFQMELASTSGIDMILDSNGNETGTLFRIYTNAVRGGAQTLLFTVNETGGILGIGPITLTPAASNAIQLNPFGAAAGNASELRFLELTASGTNYTGFKAPDAIIASEIYVLPDAAPAANRFLRAGAVAAGVSTLSWAQVSLTADVTGILPVANGGSGTSTAFTAGSVIFAGAAGVFAQDNANFFWDDTNNWLGLGIAVPLARLHVVSSAAATIAVIIKAAAAQSANLTEWQSSAGVANAVINAAGNISIPTTTSTVGIIFQGADRLIHTFGTTNLFMGVGAGNFTLTGASNVGLGGITLVGVTSGMNNLAVGFAASLSNTTGSNNVALGQNALRLTTVGSTNTAIGSSSMQNNLDGALNVAIGYQSLFNNISGTNHVAIGYQANFSSTTSNNNTGIGTLALFLATGGANIAIGSLAGDNITTGTRNTVIGFNIDSPTATNSDTLTIGNLIFGAGVNGSGTTLASGGIGIRVITPTAYLHLCAGTTAVSTAPLKFNTGTSMTAAEAGAVEFTTDDLFFTITTGAARKRLLMADATAGLTSGKIPIATTNGRLIDLTASSAYTPTNVTTDRAYDANATSVDELGDVLGTLIADLQTKGILG